MKHDQDYSLLASLRVFDDADSPQIIWSASQDEAQTIAANLTYHKADWDSRVDWQVAIGTAEPDRDVVPAMPIYRLCKLARFKFLEKDEFPEKKSGKKCLIQLPDDLKITAELISPLPNKPGNLLLLLPKHLIRHAWNEITVKTENESHSEQAQSMNAWLQKHVYGELGKFTVTKDHVKYYRRTHR